MLTARTPDTTTAEVSAAPAISADIPLLTYHDYGVEFRQGMPPLPTEIFYILRERVAAIVTAAAQRREIALTPAECEARAELTIALFHARGQCGLLYCGDEAAVERLKGIVDWALQQGSSGATALDQAIEAAKEARRAEWNEPRLDRPPLPQEVSGAACARALPALRAIAQRKNVPSAIAQCDERVHRAIEFLRIHGLAEKLLEDDPEAVELMEYAADNDLDGLAILHAVLASARAQGIADDQLDWDLVGLTTGEALVRLRDRYPTGSFFRWPELDAGMATAFAEFGIPALDLRVAVKT